MSELTITNWNDTEYSLDELKKAIEYSDTNEEPLESSLDNNLATPVYITKGLIEHIENLEDIISELKERD